MEDNSLAAQYQSSIIDANLSFVASSTSCPRAICDLRPITTRRSLSCGRQLPCLCTSEDVLGCKGISSSPSLFIWTLSKSVTKQILSVAMLAPVIGSAEEMWCMPLSDALRGDGDLVCVSPRYLRQCADHMWMSSEVQYQAVPPSKQHPAFC
ncbi:hypothetical protein OBBRIDRAFT_574417 [Obba rivulosa]|uniref:Uncharacterized protein n=1 Tax=Obba rivulosa TaxID=1052685 RepID=A0A8E2DTK9_9APHY|nr:hypothetical protein OBBRIDRAFT_574417 [Obba rivulosa]